MAFPVDTLILVASALLLTAILSSKLSARSGTPVLLVFMGVGMLAGENGPLGIAFDDVGLAHAVGTVALVLILFDGGLRSPLSAVRLAWKPAALLATLGVVGTAAITGVIAAWVLDQPLPIGLLLGSIVGSTDAAAVFASLRGQGLHLRARLSATLEVESGSNDPMAVLLTVGLLAYIGGTLEPGMPMVWFFLRQAVFGVAFGLLVGWAGVHLVNRANLTAAGLYPALTGGVGFLAYGITVYFGGSGFLAAYLAGITMGNANIAFKRGIMQAHDGGAWLGQIVMFVVLGLLATPSRIISVAPEGALVAMGLVLVARPVTVFLLAWPFRFRLAELVFISAAGLKGAIPIILAIFPLLQGLPEGILIFDVVFFVVVISALSQGSSLARLATWLGVREERPPEPPVTLEITSIQQVDGDIVDYLVEPRSLASGRRVRELALPESAVLAMIVRGNEIIPPRGSTALHPGDHVFVVLKSSVREVVDRLFARRRRPITDRQVAMAFPLAASTTAAEVEEFYGIHLDPDPTRNLGDILAERLGPNLIRGAEVEAGEYRLAAGEVVDGVVTVVEVEVLRDVEGEE